MSNPSSEADFEVVDGHVVPVVKTAAPEFIEPAPLDPPQWRRDEDIANDAPPSNAPSTATDPTLTETEQTAVESDPSAAAYSGDQPDPGNSSPENWTEPCSDEELSEVQELLQVDPNEEA